MEKVQQKIIESIKKGEKVTLFLPRKHGRTYLKKVLKDLFSTITQDNK